MNRQRIRLLQEQYPPGTRIQLDSMSDDPRPIPAGTKGTVQLVDDGYPALRLRQRQASGHLS